MLFLQRQRELKKRNHSYSRARATLFVLLFATTICNSKALQRLLPRRNHCQRASLCHRARSLSTVNNQESDFTRDDETCCNNSHSSNSAQQRHLDPRRGYSRQDMLRILTGGMTMATAFLTKKTPALAAGDSNIEATDDPVPSETKVYKTSSGLKYMELREGTGVSPAYGQLCSLKYTAYVKLPATSKDTNPKPKEYDSSDGYLVKHGNGRTVLGLDEGLHTMRVGGRRRLILPPKLGYIESGQYGPIPASPFARYNLNKLLEEMVERRGGTLIFDVTLLFVMDDEADQGYYQDNSLSEEEFEFVKAKLQRTPQ